MIAVGDHGMPGSGLEQVGTNFRFTRLSPPSVMWALTVWWPCPTLTNLGWCPSAQVPANGREPTPEAITEGTMIPQITKVAPNAAKVQSAERAASIMGQPPTTT